MSRRTRIRLALAALAVLGGLAVAAVAGLPDFGHPQGPYAAAAVEASLDDRHVTATVGGVTFDVRGIDTLGEELILFCAAIGATVLLRAQRGEREGGAAAERADAARPRMAASLRALGANLVGPVLVLGIYVIAHGHLTPGGGFQGGVILASALLLVFAAGQVIGVRRLRPASAVEVAEAVGAGAYALVALGGLLFAGAAMANFLPLGTTGQLLSGGTIPVLNVAVGIEVAAGITLIVSELLDQALLREPGDA